MNSSESTQAISGLELEWRVRAGGGGRTERRFLDLVVSGVSLFDQLKVGDQVTTLGCWEPAFERQTIQQLLLQMAPESPSGRVPLYVCAECGDLGCGAIFVFVEKTPAGVVWRDFAYENTYDATMTDVGPYRGVGPFVFDKTAYWQLFTSRAALLSD